MSANNYSPILTKGLESELTTYTAGLLRFTTDTNRIFLDTGSNSRVEFTDFVKGLTKSQILALTTGILPKIYLASDTYELFVYDTTSTEWNLIGAAAKTNTDSFYGVCDTAAATALKTVSVSDPGDNFTIRAGILISVKFTYDVPANATLSVNSTTAKSIFYHGAAITDDIIGAGDLALFVYNGTQYDLIAVDSISVVTGDYGDLDSYEEDDEEEDVVEE